MAALAFQASTKKYATGGIAGTNFDITTDDPCFGLGDVCHGTGNSIWVYVKAGAAIAAGGTCGINATTFVTSSGSTHKAQAAFAAGKHGWVENVAGAA